MENKDKEQYTWYLKDSYRFDDDNIFDSIEECIENAKNKFNKGIDEFSDYLPEDKYDGDISPIITIGIIERFDTKNAIKSIIEDMDDRMSELLGDFTSGCDDDPESCCDDDPEFCFNNEDARKEFAEKGSELLMPLVEKCMYCFPSMVAKPLFDYDLLKNEKIA